MVEPQSPPPPPLTPTPTGRRWLRWPNVLATLAILLLVDAGGVAIWVRVRPHDTLVATSPDGAHRVIVREPMRTLDRNFSVFLVDPSTGIEREIFDSYDQDPSIKREWIVWSDDSSKFALIGHRYFVVPGAGLPGGETVFLVYDLDADRLWCNTDHVGRGLTPITATQAEAVIGKPLE